MKRPAITVIGGGVFVVKMCRSLAAHPALHPGEIRLVARRYERLRVIAAACQRVLDEHGRGWTVSAAPSLAEGLNGAGVVVVLVRAGGLAARAGDEAFPRAFGLTGDEGLGPGGMANALRTTPLLRAVADTVARVAPKAWVLNMVAPLGVATRVLLDRGLRAIGVCELPTLTERRLLVRAGLRSRPGYAGFNHLGWFWGEGEDAAKLIRAAVEARLADVETAAVFGAAPLRYYYELFSPTAAERLGFARSPRRADELLALSERVFARLRDGEDDAAEALEERPTPWFDEALVPIIAALASDAVYDGFVDVRNEGRLPMVSNDVVVEVRARIVGGRVEAENGGRPPAPVEAFLAAVGRSEMFVYEAVRTDCSAEQSGPLAAALEALPLPRIAGELADLVGQIIDASRRSDSPSIEKQSMTS